jgi:hypothetical protein
MLVMAALLAATVAAGAGHAMDLKSDVAADRNRDMRLLFEGLHASPEADPRAAAKGRPPVGPHHSPFFKADGEAVVMSGARAMTAAALAILGS